MIQKYYQEIPLFKGKKEFEQFLRLDKESVKIAPWYNKEIFIKIYQTNEGRDLDNQHPYPYICLQVRTDRDTGQRILSDSRQSQNFLRN